MGCHTVLPGTIVGIPKAICYSPKVTFIAEYNYPPGINLFTATYSKYGHGLDGTPVNSPIVEDNMLNLEGGVSPNLGKYVDYSATYGNANESIQTGCIRIRFIPPINPGEVYYDSKLFAIIDNEESTKNLLEFALYNSSNDYEVYLTMYDKNGGEILNQSFGVWNTFVKDTPYELEVNWNLTLGETRVFINGEQFGSLATATGERDENVSIIRMGNGLYPQYSSSNHKIDSLVIFNDVINTWTYTPGTYEDLLSLPDHFMEDYLIADGQPINNY